VEGEARKPPAILSLAWDTRSFDAPPDAGPSGTGGAAGPAFLVAARTGSGSWAPFQGSQGVWRAPATCPTAGLPFPPGLTVHRPGLRSSSPQTALSAMRRRCSAPGKSGGGILRRSRRGYLQSSGGAGAPVARTPSRAYTRFGCSGMGARSTDPKRAPAPISGERMRRCRQRWPQANLSFGEEFADHRFIAED